MNVADMIRAALEKKGIQSANEAAKVLGLSPELLRLTLNQGHIPKDKTLAQIAKELDMDQSVLILAAHQARVPLEVKSFFLAPTAENYKSGKRRYPLSEEQCNYLAKIMSADEIQILRKLRQVTESGKIQIHGFVEFIFRNMPKEQPDKTFSCRIPLSKVQPGSFDLSPSPDSP